MFLQIHEVLLQGTTESGLLQTWRFPSTISILETCCPSLAGPIPAEESWFLSGNMGEETNSRMIVFPQQHLTLRERSHGATPCPLGDRVPLLTCWTPSLRTGSPQPEDAKISFLWRTCLLVGKIDGLPKPPPSPLECLCEGPAFPVVTPLLLAHIPKCPKCQYCPHAESRVQLCK